MKTIAAFATVMLAFFMAMLDTTIVNISLPAISSHFSVPFQIISWVANGYNLAFAVVLITASRLADQFGRKKVFMLGLMCFTVASFACGISTSAPQLIFFRVLQGLAAALLVPVTMPIVLRMFPENKSGTIVGIWAAIAGLAAAGGPALGGIITETMGWQWIFFINIPLGCIALVLTIILVEESFDTTITPRTDFVGMISLTSALFPLCYALITANDYGWTSIRIVALFILSGIGFTTFFLSEHRSEQPMVPIALLKNRPFFFGNAALFLLGMGLMNGIFFLSFFLTRVMGMGELKAGLIITALPLTSTFFSAGAGLLSDRYGSRFFAAGGMAVLCVGVWLCSGLTPQTTTNQIIWLLMISGAGIGCAMAPIIGAIIRSVTTDKIGMASGIGNMTRTVGTVFGIALIVLVFTRAVHRDIGAARGHTIDIVNASTVLKPQIKKVITDQLVRVDYSEGKPVPTLVATLKMLDAKKNETLASSPDFLKAGIEKIFEKQKNEVTRLYPIVRQSFLGSLCHAFSSTFKFNSLLLILGVGCALFCEPWKKNIKHKLKM